MSQNFENDFSVTILIFFLGLALSDAQIGLYDNITGASVRKFLK